MHAYVLVEISTVNKAKYERQILDVQADIESLIQKVRNLLKRLSNETKQLCNPHEVIGRKAQQAAYARRLIDVCRKYEHVQSAAKANYRARIVREMKVADPNATSTDINDAIASGGKVFGRQMLESNGKRQVLADVSARHRGRYIGLTQK